MKNKVLIVEDDQDLGHLLKQYLEFNEFEVNRVFNGEEARAELLNNRYDILVLDVMMPEEDGFTLAGKLSLLYPDLPFLFVTARKNKEDILLGLKLGADDYITKPFEADELVMRIKNILKRSTVRTEPLIERIPIGNYIFEPKNLLLILGKEETLLTVKEAKLLHYLMLQSKQKLIKREDILNHLWGEADFFNGRSLDVFISRLRKHLSKDQGIKIEALRNAGYRITIHPS